MATQEVQKAKSFGEPRAAGAALSRICIEQELYGAGAAWSRSCMEQELHGAGAAWSRSCIEQELHRTRTFGE